MLKGAYHKVGAGSTQRIYGCCVTLFPGRHGIYLLHIENQWQSKVRIPLKSNLVYQRVLFVLLKRAEITYQQLHQQSLHHCGRTIHNTWNLEHTLEPEENSTGWWVSFPSGAVDLSLSQAAQLASVCVLAFLSAYVYLRRDPISGSLVSLINFRDFLKTLSCLLSQFKEHPSRMAYFFLTSS